MPSPAAYPDAADEHAAALAGVELSRVTKPVQLRTNARAVANSFLAELNCTRCLAEFTNFPFHGIRFKAKKPRLEPDSFWPFPGQNLPKM